MVVEEATLVEQVLMAMETLLTAMEMIWAMQAGRIELLEARRRVLIVMRVSFPPMRDLQRTNGLKMVPGRPISRVLQTVRGGTECMSAMHSSCSSLSYC